MYFTALLALFIIAISADDQMEECNTVFEHEHMHCCAMRNGRPFSYNIMEVPDDLKECLDMPIDPLSCAREECIARKRGFFSDGKIDTKVLTSLFEKQMNKDPEVMALIKENCLSDSTDLSKFGMPDMCELIRMRLCVYFQFLKKCSEWMDTAVCQDMSNLMTKCSTVL